MAKTTNRNGDAVMVLAVPGEGPINVIRYVCSCRQTACRLCDGPRRYTVTRPDHELGRLRLARIGNRAG
jgi:hypothetical protein